MFWSVKNLNGNKCKKSIDVTYDPVWETCPTKEMKEEIAYRDAPHLNIINLIVRI